MSHCCEEHDSVAYLTGLSSAVLTCVTTLLLLTVLLLLSPLQYTCFYTNQVRAAALDRATAESSLQFAGFVAFTCRVRKDTADVVAQLREGGHAVVMVTGDALLTALHVAKEVSVCVYIAIHVLIQLP
jgi:magnesium-transporting ATPase (P-type)